MTDLPTAGPSRKAYTRRSTYSENRARGGASLILGTPLSPHSERALISMVVTSDPARRCYLVRQKYEGGSWMVFGISIVILTGIGSSLLVTRDEATVRRRRHARDRKSTRLNSSHV